MEIKAYFVTQGNQVFADMLPDLICVIEKPGMFVIDEFGNSLHNRLAERIIKFFMEKASNSQMFVTSHDTSLFTKSIFRPDQINLLTFMDAKGSCVKRISQFKPREAQNVEKMYLGGMFEGRIRTQWSEQVNPDNVLPEYPRPIMERTEWKNLNGLDRKSTRLNSSHSH